MGSLDVSGFFSQALKEVLVASVLFGARWQEVGLPHKIPIACVGCGKADKVRTILFVFSNLTDEAVKDLKLEWF